MPIPDYQFFMRPLLQACADRQEHSIREIQDLLANELKLTIVERTQLLPSGKQRVYCNRIGWAKTYLIKAGLLTSKKRGHVEITERGLQLLKQGYGKIDKDILKQFPEFAEFINGGKEEKLPSEKTSTTEMTPEEELEAAYQSIRQRLAQELLEQIKNCSPYFFEKLVIELLVKMGYGGSIKDAGNVIGKSGDGGIDGIIKEDRLGLDIIYIQAKKWENTVGRPEVQKFAGALQGQRANKGIFLTTAKFSSEAYDYVARVSSKIILIDGEQLADYMIDYDLGVSKSVNYEIKKIDSDYFIED